MRRNRQSRRNGPPTLTFPRRTWEGIKINAGRRGRATCEVAKSSSEGDQSAAFADTDFSDDDLGFGGLGSDVDDLDSAAGFESDTGFDDESVDAVVPLVAGFSVVEVESVSVLGVLFLA
jgi:hypothetical protein